MRALICGGQSLSCEDVFHYLDNLISEELDEPNADYGLGKIGSKIQWPPKVVIISNECVSHQTVVDWSQHQKKCRVIEYSDDQYNNNKTDGMKHIFDNGQPDIVIVLPGNDTHSIVKKSRDVGIPVIDTNA